MKFNDISLQLTINIKGENENPTIANERVSSKEELARILRKGTSKARAAISLIPFQDLGLKVWEETTDGTRIL